MADIIKVTIQGIEKSVPKTPSNRPPKPHPEPLTAHTAEPPVEPPDTAAAPPQ